MKYTLTLGLALGLSTFAISQNVGINGTGAAPNASSMLDVVASDKGILVPRVALTATNTAGPITLPETSLLVYNTNTAGAGATAVTPGYYYNAGTPALPNWVRFMNGNGTAWMTLGNAGTTAATNFVGTTDNIALRFRTNSIERFEMTTDGRLRSFNLGTAALPTYSWNGDPNTGVFSPGADQIDFSTNGTARFRIPNANQVHALSLGTAALPFYSFSADPNTGILSPGADQLDFSTNGTARFRIPNANQVHALSSGTFALPFYSFSADPNTGILNTNPDQLTISTGGIPATSIFGDQTLLHTSNSTTFDGTEIYSGIGMSNGVGAIWSVNDAPAGNGTGYGTANVNYSILGWIGGTRQYSFGVSGQSPDVRRSGAIHGMSPDPNPGAPWASLGYRTSAGGGGTYTGVYSTAALVTGTGFSSTNVARGLAYLGYSDFIGSIIRSEIVGQVSIGKLMASYNIGNEYTSGYSADVITLNNGEKQVAYNNTSTELKIYNDGQANLTEGKKFIEFDNAFKNSLKKESLPTITVSPMGECNGLFVLEVTKDGFWVKEMMSGNSNVSFSWIAIGKRNDEIDLPMDILNKNFDSNISKVAPNENDPNEEGNSAYWDGEKFVFGKDAPIPTNGLKAKNKTLPENKRTLKKH